MIQSMILFGILNVTADSFSDGGEFLDPTKANEKGMELIANGAHIIDISAQSSNINANQIEPELEWARIENLIQRFHAAGYKISVDTYKPYVIRKSIEANVSYINNINSFRDKESLSILADHKDSLPDLVLMYYHNNGDMAEAKSDLTPNTIMDSIYRFFDQKISDLQRLGVSETKFIFDPGMGLFLGADPLLSIEVLKNISEFKKRFGRVMVSVSRKSFIGNLLGGIPPKDRGAGTLTVELYLYQQNIEMIRTHDVKQLSQAMRLMEALK